ncbi:hypothetical protein ABIF63_009685 [Bradyrhizobium japonicum]|uniref:Uncharacterized protein n=1 Tax=Bradyrhizobium japonicum TaxID=375 RepID=A0ABV2S8S7_BRAJP
MEKAPTRRAWDDASHRPARVDLPRKRERCSEFAARDDIIRLELSREINRDATPQRGTTAVSHPHLSSHASLKPSLTPMPVVIRFLTLQRVMVGNCSSSIQATGTSSTRIFCALS